MGHSALSNHKRAEFEQNLNNWRASETKQWMFGAVFRTLLPELPAAFDPVNAG
jgi:hypothetical protein